MKRRGSSRSPLATLVLLGFSAAGLPAQEEPEALPDAGAHHLNLLPTARTHPAGTRTAGVFGYVFPFLGYAVTDDFHVGGGIPLLALIEGFPAAFFTPKLRLLDYEEVAFAVGNLSWASLERGEGRFQPGVLYVVATYERAPLALTGGVGKGFGDLGGPLFAMGGAEAILLENARDGDDGIKVMVEAFGLPMDDNQFLGGASAGALTVRFHDPGVAFDVGIAWAGDSGRLEVIGYPIVGLTITY